MHKIEEIICTTHENHNKPEIDQQSVKQKANVQICGMPEIEPTKSKRAAFVLVLTFERITAD